MRNSKKGITLVELIICCAIITLLAGACTTVLASGSHIFNKSTQAAGVQLDADVLQTSLMNLIPSAHNVSNDKSMDEVKDLTDGYAIYFDDSNDGLFTLRNNGRATTIQSVKEFTYSIIRAGDPASGSARAQFVYEAVMIDGSKFSGGFIFNNLKYNPDTMDAIDSISVANTPVCFNLSE